MNKKTKQMIFCALHVWRYELQKLTKDWTLRDLQPTWGTIRDIDAILESLEVGLDLKYPPKGVPAMTAFREQLDQAAAETGNQIMRLVPHCHKKASLQAAYDSRPDKHQIILACDTCGEIVGGFPVESLHAARRTLTISNHN